MASGITGFRAGVHVGMSFQKHLHDGQMPFPRCQNQRRHASLAANIGVSAVSETLAHLVDVPAFGRRQDRCAETLAIRAWTAAVLQPCGRVSLSV